MNQVFSTIRMVKSKYSRKILLAGCLFFIVLVGFPALWIVWDGVHDQLAVADVAIVLGNKVEPDGRPSVWLQARLDKAVELYKKGMFQKVIVSGAVGKEGFDEAAVMKGYLISQGIPEDHIMADNQGNNTFLTAKNASRIMKAQKMQSALVISQHYHISRARFALKRFGISPVYSAHADYFEFEDVFSTLREVAAFYVYVLRKYE